MTIGPMGSLIVVGTGIQLINHITQEARSHIERADKVFHVVADQPTDYWLKTLNASAESLNTLYKNGRSRDETYALMVERIVTEVRGGKSVCAVFYGHPGVFVHPGHEAIRMARAEGYEARMLPGISSEDCLFADLGIDPGSCGCQSFEATDFLVHRRRFDPSSALILWQIGVIGPRRFSDESRAGPGIKVLVEALKEHYPPDHDIIVYMASPFPYPVAGPSIQRMKLTELPGAKIRAYSTLYVPPMLSLRDAEMAERLGL